MQQRADDGRRHARDAGGYAAASRRRVVQPAKRKDEEDGREQVAGLRQVLRHYSRLRSRNIRSIRYVIMKPLTMFVIEAATATVPRIVANVECC